MTCSGRSARRTSPCLLYTSSPSTVHVHLKALEAKGYIKRDPLKSRSIALTYHLDRGDDAPEVVSPTFSKVVNVPLVGNVAAGSPILAEENITDTLTLPTDIVGDSPSFCLLYTSRCV